MSILKEGDDILGKPDDAYSTPFLGADLELDSTINTATSRRREISLYRHDELVLIVEHGITLGFLKLCYSSHQKFTGVLQGVRSRCSTEDSPVSSVLLSDDRVLDESEYELIILDQVPEQDILHQNLSPTLPALNSTLSTVTSLSSSVSLSATMPSASISLPSTKGAIINPPNINADKKTGSFVCEYCHLPFISKAKYLRHRRIHTEENPYLCIYCHETFSHHSDLRKHRNEMHMTNKSFKCSYCPKTFGTRAELKGHLWRHTGEKAHKCRICGNSFATKGNLKLHIDKHVGIHKHKCPFCPQRFTSHSSLEAHMAKHTGMRAYKCRYCPKSYAQAGQLTSHERLHTGEKPFVCQVCGKAFRLNSTRLAHEKRHSGARPHICDTCGRSFAMQDHLRRHVKTHENKLDRLVACPFCKKKIFSGRNMRKHLIRHRELSLTENQAKAIAASLKPDREMNERDLLEDDQTSTVSTRNSRQQAIQCAECDEEFKSVRKLFEHLTAVHYQRELTAVERKEMRLRHGLQKLHHCNFCSAFFIDFRLLRSHVLSEHSERAEEIGFTGKNNIENQQHQRGNSNAIHKCPNCSSVYFNLRSDLEQHIIKDHLTSVLESGGFSGSSVSSEKLVHQFKCWYCVASFQSPEQVVNHMTNEHESLDMLSKRVENTEQLNDVTNSGENDVTTSGVWSCPNCPVNLKSHEEYLEHLAIHHVTATVATGSTSTVVTGLSEKTNMADETSKYLNPISPTTNVESVVDKYLTKPSPSDIATATTTPTQVSNMEILQASAITLAPTSLSTNTNTVDENKGTSGGLTPNIDLVVDVSLQQNLDEESLTQHINKSSSPTISTEQYLTWSSLSAEKSDVHRATADLSFLSSDEYKSHLDEQQQQQALQHSDLNEDILIKADENVNSHVISEQTSTLIAGLVQEQIETDSNVTTSGQLLQIINEPKAKKSRKKKKHRAGKQKGGKCNKLFSESCQYCSNVFRSKIELTNHLKLSHQNIKTNNTDLVPHQDQIPFRCWFCSSNFNNPEEVVAHMTNEHDNLDNLSRRVEMADGKLDSEKGLSKLKHKNLSDASLSPADGLSCPKCPKTMGSKEAYELHLLTHQTLNSNEQQELLKLKDFVNRQRSIDRAVVANNIGEDVTLGDQVPIVVAAETSAAFVDTNICSKTSEQQQQAKVKPVINKTAVKKKGKKSTQTSQGTSSSLKSVSHKPGTSLALVKPLKPAVPALTVSMIDGSGNLSVNMCPHCSRVFCGKKALDVHTLKMHGKEYLQKRPQETKLSTFTCWFCSAHFKTPELVVEHMTKAHENLDNLSKRIEGQELPRSPGSKTPKIVSVSPKFIPIAPQQSKPSTIPGVVKQPVTTPTIGTCPQKPSDNQQPPPGYKISYALAYVPVYVPDRNDENEENKE